MTEDKNQKKKPKRPGLGYRIDDLVLDCVNHIVKAWNWTTGRTRSELANMLCTCGWIGISAAGVLEGIVDNQPAGYLLGPVMFMPVHIFQTLNKQIDSLEVNAAEAECKEAMAEHHKMKYAQAGYILPIMAAGFQSMPDRTDGVHPISAITASLAGIGISCQIMRADYLPPRKNALARLRDWVSEKIESKKLSTAMIRSLSSSAEISKYSCES